MKKIYVGCSLTHASLEFLQGIEDFKDALRDTYEVLDFVGLEDGTARDVYEDNCHRVMSADLVIAECSYPSIGLWYELALAIEIGKPTVILAQKDAIVTRMVLGIPKEKAMFIRYTSLNDILPQIQTGEFSF